MTSEADVPEALTDRRVHSYLDTAALVTIATTATYYLGWSYIDAYFERLGLHHVSFDLPTTLYLREAFFPVTLGVILVFYSFKQSNSTKPWLRAARGNLLLFVGTGLVLDYALDELPSFAGWLCLLFSLIMALMALDMTRRGKSFLPDQRRPSPLASVMLAILGFMTLVLVSRTLGAVHARKRVEGTLHNVAVVTLHTDDKALQALSNGPLILIWHYGDTYYVARQQSPVPKYLTTYAIPSDKVAFVEQRRIR